MSTTVTKLHPDLVPYIETGPPFGPTIDHPLVRNHRMITPEDVLYQ